MRGRVRRGRVMRDLVTILCSRWIGGVLGRWLPHTKSLCSNDQRDDLGGCIITLVC